MCPPPKPPPPPEIDLQCNDEQVVLFLDKYSEESNLPNNVLGDLSPYQYPPSNLPEGIWYMVRSVEKREWIHGLWKIKEAPREIYSNGVITGWKTTLEYFKGQPPNERRTDWVMQEYGITRKELCDKDKTKVGKLLCRVFCGSEIETHPQSSEPEVESKLNEFDFLASIIPDINSPFGPNSLNETMVNWEAELAAMVEADDNKTTFAPQNTSELNCIPRDDYIELNDLVDPGSLSSSSRNSSCTSLSDEYFDPVDLLQEIEEDERKKQSNSKYAFTAPDKSNDAPPELQMVSDADTTKLLEGPQTGTTEVESLIDKDPEPQSGKRGNLDSKTEDTATTSSSGSQNAGPSRDKKASSSRLKKVKLCFCFLF